MLQVLQQKYYYEQIHDLIRKTDMKKLAPVVSLHQLTAYVHPVGHSERVWVSTLCYICGCDQSCLESLNSVSEREKQHFNRVDSTQLRMDSDET